MRRSRSWTRIAAACIAALALGLGLVACSDDDDDGGDTTAAEGGGGGKVALLLPESQTTRYEAHDQPEFESSSEKALPGLRD